MSGKQAGRGVSLHGMKVLNRSAIVNYIYKYGPVSRTEISKITNASMATVSRVVNQLLRDRMVRGLEAMDSDGVGRKPELVEFNSDLGHVVGVYIGERYVIVALCDLKGKVLFKTKTSLHKINTREAFVQLLIEKISELKNSLRNINLLSIAVASVGVVDAKKGMIVVASERPELNKLPIVDELSSHFKVEVYVENDVNMAAVGEFISRSDMSISDMVYVQIAAGIGAGIIINGNIHHGFMEGAGEISYCITDSCDLWKNKHQMGSLEEYINLNEIESSLLKMNLITEEKILDNISNSSEQEYLVSLLELAENGNKEAKALVDSVVCKLAMTICNIACLLNPQVIVLGGIVVQAWSNMLLEKIKDAVEMAYPMPPQVMCSQLEHPELLGAVKKALSKSLNKFDIDYA